MEDDYRGRTALVTGASKGLGRAYALELARRGSRVILLARSEPELRALAAEIGATHGGQPAEVITGDLSAPDGPQQILRELRTRGLTVDLLVNNAGAGITGPFLQRAIEPQLRTVGLNVVGLLALTHALGADMVARGTGGIINVSSNGAFQPVPYQASYAATKAFVLSFTEALAEELRGTGVHVMATHPGATATGFFDGTSVTMDPGADTPETVAAHTLDDYRRRRSASYPGRTMNRVMTWAARLLPRTTVAQIAGSVSRRQRWDRTVDVA